MRPSLPPRIDGPARGTSRAILAPQGGRLETTPSRAAGTPRSRLTASGPASDDARARRPRRAGRPCLGAPALAIVGALAAGSARAQAVDLPPVEIVVDEPAPTSLGTGVSVVIPAARAIGTPETLADLVASTPGVHVRRMGLPGSFTSVSIRGLGGEYIAVVLDDVPLSSATLGPVNLAAYPAAALERLEVYRGAGPVRFESPLGGVIRLVSRPPGDDVALSAHAAVGSFGTRSAHLSVAGPLAGNALGLFVAYEGTDGDFAYYDDKNTLYDSADDRRRVRANNAVDALTLRLTGSRAGPAGGRLRLTLNGQARAAGVAGPGALVTTRTSLADREIVGRLTLLDMRLAGDSARVAVGADAIAATRRFADPEREVGVGFAATDTRLFRGGVDARLEWLWGLSHETELAPRVAWDAFRFHASSRTPIGDGDTRRSRLQLGAGLEHRADLGPVRLIPSLRADLAHDAGDDVAGAGVTTALSPRLGLLWLAGPCELRANLGRFHRLPTTLERFGDGALVLENLALDVERGASADTAVTCTTRPFGLETRAELAGFASRVSGLIVYVPQSQLFPRPTNLDEDEIAGLEAALATRAAHARAELAYTLTRAADVSGVDHFRGKATVGVPRHRLHLALDLGSRAHGVRYELTFASRTYLDRANTRPAPARLSHDVYAHAAIGAGFEAKLSVTNLTDAVRDEVPLPPDGELAPASRVDFRGYPLPGRAWLASLVWRNE